MDLSLKNRTALVCGATQGIGRATANELAKLGANVIVAARREAELQAVVAELSNDGEQQHEYLILDMADHQMLTERLSKRLANGAIEILIHNTGGPQAGKISQASAQNFEDAFQQHLLSARLMAELMLPGMKQQGFGRFVYVTSTSVKIPIPNLGVSNTVRWAVSAWAKTLSQEVAADGITANIVMPGFTQTPRLDSLVANQAKNLNKSETEVMQNMTATIPARRVGEASEVANAIAFLASPAASYINGVSLAVDGGRTGCL